MLPFWQKFFTAVVITYPFVSLYGINVSTISVADVLLAVSLFILAFINILQTRRINILYPFLIFFSYIVICSLFILPMQHDFMNILLRTVRYLYLLLALIFFVKSNFVFEYGKKLLLFFSILATLLIIIQACFLYLKGVYIQGYLPGLPILREELTTFADYMQNYELDIRPRSFFGEPAHYAVYEVCGLSLVLFSEKHNRRFWLMSVFMTFGILISVSSTGILCAMVLWAIFVFKNKKSSWIVIPCMLLIGSIIYSTSFVQLFLDRIEEGKSAAGRFDGYMYLLSNIDELSFTEFIFGQGMYDPTLYPEYLAGYARLFVCFGLLGVVLFLFAIFSLYRRQLQLSNILLILFLILNIGTEIALGPYLLVYISLIVGYISKHNKKHNKYYDILTA